MKRLSTLVLAALACVISVPSFAQGQVAREQRDQFAATTAERCIQTQRADPTQAAQTDAGIRQFCACYSRRVAEAMPDDVLNTSVSAATPEQLATTQSIMRQSAQACRSASQP